MPNLFERTTVNGMSLENRFVRSATYEGMATDTGMVTEKLTGLMKDLARGGVGLIISGHAYVSREGRAGPLQLGVYEDALVPGLRDMTDAVHALNGKIVLQLAHAGAMAVRQQSGRDPVGPSVIHNMEDSPCREMSREDISKMTDSFGRAALRAQKAGFDGVQIHAAHGYLLSQFLSPFFNKRKDEYGGTLENRARLMLEVLGCIRSIVGNRYPVLVKMNSEDFLENGLTQDEMLRVASMLRKGGIDAVELSGGTGLSGRFTPIRRGRLEIRDQEAYYREAAARFKKTIQVPLILVGGIRSYETAEELIRQGVTDYVAMCRPLIREPGLINRWKKGDRTRAECVSDNLCFGPTREGKGIYCVTEEKLKGRPR